MLQFTLMMWSFVLFLVVIVLAVLALPTDVYAAGSVEYRLQVNTEIINDQKARSKLKVLVSSDDPKDIPSSLRVPVIGNKLTGLKASYGSGSLISSSYNPSSNTITLDRLSEPSGSNGAWEFEIEYSSSFGQQLGSTEFYLIPPITSSDFEPISTNITIVAGFDQGIATAMGQEESSKLADATKQKWTWKLGKDDFKQAVGLRFGDSAVFDFAINHTLDNRSWWWKDQTIILPPDTNQQQVYLAGITPKPKDISLDQEGNIYVTWSLSPRQTKAISVNGQIRADNLLYSQSGELGINDIDENLIDRYTTSFDAWPAGELKYKKSDSVNNLVKAIFDSAIDNHQSDSDATIGKLVGELRDNKIPARQVDGLIFFDGLNFYPEATAHKWVEAYLPEVGWISLDPTQADSQNMYAQADARRVAQSIRQTPEFDEDIVIPEIKVEASVENGLPEDILTPDVTATSHMILPGLAFRSVNIDLPAGLTTDGTGLDIDNQQIFLGSLAPFETAAYRSILFGPAAFSDQDVRFGLVGPTDLDEVLAASSTSINYLPMISLLAVVAGGFLAIKWLRRLRIRRTETIKPTKERLVFAREHHGEDIERAELVRLSQDPRKALDSRTEQSTSDDATIRRATTKRVSRRIKSDDRGEKRGLIQ